jgi:hypothetical protein
MAKMQPHTHRNINHEQCYKSISVIKQSTIQAWVCGQHIHVRYIATNDIILPHAYIVN